jgi:Fatty acid cis/trans isomerase (CTI)
MLTILPRISSITLVNGFLGAYPNAFYVVQADRLRDLLEAVENLNSEAGYAALSSRFAIRRADARFWPHSDALHAAYRRSSPVEAGLFDYNRFENR